jgi:hypothetical protein
MAKDNLQLTIPEVLETIRKSAYQCDDAEKASNLLNKLASLLGSITELWIDAEMKYNRYYEDMTDKFEKVSEARAKAKASDEYENKLRNEGYLEVTKELINAMKYQIKVKMAERQESRFQ